MPDRFGTNLLRTYFTDKGLTEKDIDVFTKLQYIGSRSMGAIEYRPATEIEQMVVGEKFNIKKRKKIFEKIKSVVDKFRNYAERNHVKPELINKVEENRPRIEIR